MTRIIRLVVAASFIALPALALARPPQIYHQSVTLAAKPASTVRLILGSQDAQITVRPVKSVTVTVDIWADADSADAKAKIIKRLAPTASMQGNDVVVRTPENHGVNWSFGWHESPDVLVSVVMPPDMNVAYQLGSGDFHFDNAQAANLIQGESGSGDASVDSASKRLVLKSGSGDITVKLSGTSDSVALHSGSGEIEFAGAAKTLKFASGSGDIEVKDAAAKSASLDSGSGDIEAHWRKLAAGASITGNANSGDVEMYFPAGTVISGSISTGSGDVDTDFPTTINGNQQSYTLSGGAGAIHVVLDTGSGDVTLGKRG